MRIAVVILLFSLVAATAFAFQTTIPTTSITSRSRPAFFRESVGLSMCICIDCARVTNCKAYHFVESKHQQPHINKSPTFEPRDGSPTIHVNVRTHRNDDEVARIWNEHNQETIKAEAAAATDDPTQALHDETVYDLSPHTTIEYDVVACADFVKDPGCWVRNMPDEIRQANPHFVPT